eukprot:jgi/Chlat1/8277/Chrsp78S07706
MKIKKKRGVDTPPPIKEWVERITAAPYEGVADVLRNLVWEFDKGDLQHWVDVFNYFDTYLATCVLPRFDAELKDEVQDASGFPSADVLEVLRVSALLLDNCANKHLYNSVEETCAANHLTHCLLLQHLVALLRCQDLDVVIASLHTLVAFAKRSLQSNRSARWPGTGTLSSDLFALCQGWGSKEEGLGLLQCAVTSGLDERALRHGAALHFGFYIDSGDASAIKHGLQVIHKQDVHLESADERTLLYQLIDDYLVPPSARFALLVRLRFARSIANVDARRKCLRLRLLAFVALMQINPDHDGLAAFFANEPEFVGDLVSLLKSDSLVPEDIQTLALRALAAQVLDRSRQTSVTTTITAGGHRGVLSTLMQKVVTSLTSASTACTLTFAEALMSLVTALVSSSSGCSALTETGLIPALLPLLKDLNSQHTELVSSAVHILEAFMDYSNSSLLFRDLGGVRDMVTRLKLEVDRQLEGRAQQDAADDSLVDQPSVPYAQRLLIKALLRAISLANYAPGINTRTRGDDGMLLSCVTSIFQHTKLFGAGVFALAASVTSDLIHHDPTAFPALQAAGLPDRFLEAINKGVIASSEAVCCLPNALIALCLNNAGMEMVKSAQALNCFVAIFTNPAYQRALLGDTPSVLGAGLDELMRHVPSLRPAGIEISIEILKAILELGGQRNESGMPAEASAAMDIVHEDSAAAEDAGPSVPKGESSFLLTCINNAIRLLESMLSNVESSRIFIEQKGIDRLLQLYSLPNLPLLFNNTSAAHTLSVTFRALASQHASSLSRSVKHALRDQLKLVLQAQPMLLNKNVAKLEDRPRGDLLQQLSVLESLTGLTTNVCRTSGLMLTELSTQGAQILLDLGEVHRAVLWQLGVQEQYAYSNRQLQSDDAMQEADAQSAAPADSEPSSDLEPDAERRALQPASVAVKKCVTADTLSSLSAAVRALVLALSKAMGSPPRRRDEATAGSPSARVVASALAKMSVESISCPSTATEGGDSVMQRGRYVKRAVEDAAALVYDARRRTCNTLLLKEFLQQKGLEAIISSLQDLLQALWSHLLRRTSQGGDSDVLEVVQGAVLACCVLLEHLSNASLLLTSPQATTMLASATATPSAAAAQAAEAVQSMQNRILDAVLPIWEHPLFSQCSLPLVSSVVTVLTHVYLGVSVDAQKPALAGGVSAAERAQTAAVDAQLVSTIVEMGFTRARAEEALRRVGNSSVELAMDWLINHPEVEVAAEEDDPELARALALSMTGVEQELGTAATDSVPPADTAARSPPLQSVLQAGLRVAAACDGGAFPVADLLVCICNKDGGKDRQSVLHHFLDSLKARSGDATPSALTAVSHVTALVINSDLPSRQVAAEIGVQDVALNLLEGYAKAGEKSSSAAWVPSLLLVLDAMSQVQNESKGDAATSDTALPSAAALTAKPSAENGDSAGASTLTSAEQKASGYLSDYDRVQAAHVCCAILKREPSAAEAQAVLQLSARLTKHHSIALQFLAEDMLQVLLCLAPSSLFPGYERTVAAVVRHMLEDPSTLQQAMEAEIKHTLAASLARHGSRVTPRAFLMSLAPVVARDPQVFLEAVQSVCRMEESGSRVSVLLKDTIKPPEQPSQSKDADPPRTSDDGAAGKHKAHKKIPHSFSQVIDKLLEFVISYAPSVQDASRQLESLDALDLASTNSSNKGKGVDTADRSAAATSPVKEDDMRSSQLALVLKLLTEFCLMHPSTAHVILRRDTDPRVLHGKSKSILQHIMHKLLPPHTAQPSRNGPHRDRLSEQATYLLLALCVRSYEARRRVLSEIARALSNAQASDEPGSAGLSKGMVRPFVDLVNALLSTTATPTTGSVFGFSTDMAKSMLQANIIPALTHTLQLVDLNHPDAPRVINAVLKPLELLVRMASHTDAATPSQDRLVASNPDQPVLTTGSAHRSASLPTSSQAHAQQDNSSGAAPAAVDEQMQDADAEAHASDPVMVPVNHQQGDVHRVIEVHWQRDGGHDAPHAVLGTHWAGHPGHAQQFNVGLMNNILSGYRRAAATDRRRAPSYRMVPDRTRTERPVSLSHPLLTRPPMMPGSAASSSPTGSFGTASLGAGVSTVSASIDNALGITELLDIAGADRHAYEPWGGGFWMEVPPGRQGWVYSGSRPPSEPLALLDLAIDPSYIQRGGAPDVRMLNWTDDGQPHAAGHASLAGVLETTMVSALQARIASEQEPSNAHAAAEQPTSEAVTAGAAEHTEEPSLMAASAPTTAAANNLEPGMAGLDAPIGDQITTTSGTAGARQGPADIDMHDREDRDIGSDRVSGGSGATATTVGDAQSLRSLEVEIGSRDGDDDGDRQAERVPSHAIAPRLPVNRTSGPGPIPVPSHRGPSSAQDTDDVMRDADEQRDPGVAPAHNAERPSERQGELITAPDIDPAFLEALPLELREELLASRNLPARSPPEPAGDAGVGMELDPEFLAALPHDIRAEVLQQQRALAAISRSMGHPSDMDSASIIATFPAELREEVLLTSDEAVLASLPPPLLAEAQLLRERALHNFSNSSARPFSMQRGHALATGNHEHPPAGSRGLLLPSSSAKKLAKDVEGDALVDTAALYALIRLLRLVQPNLTSCSCCAPQPLQKGLLHRVLLSLCPHSSTRVKILELLLAMLRPDLQVAGLTAQDMQGAASAGSTTEQPLFGCQTHTVVTASQADDGVPPLVSRRVLEMTTYLARHHPRFARLFLQPQALQLAPESKGKGKVGEQGEAPITLILQLLLQPRYSRSSAHLEQVMQLLEVVLRAVEGLTVKPVQEPAKAEEPQSEAAGRPAAEPADQTAAAPSQAAATTSTDAKPQDDQALLLVQALPDSYLRELPNLLAQDGLTELACTRVAAVLKLLAAILQHRRLFISELTDAIRRLTGPAMEELSMLAASGATGLVPAPAAVSVGATVLRVLQAIGSLIDMALDAYVAPKAQDDPPAAETAMDVQQDLVVPETDVMPQLAAAMEPVWEGLSACVGAIETRLSQGSGPSSSSSSASRIAAAVFPPLPPGTAQVLPMVEAFFVLNECIRKLKDKGLWSPVTSKTVTSLVRKRKLHDRTASDISAMSESSSDTGFEAAAPSTAGRAESDEDQGVSSFVRFAERHRRLLNAFIRQSPALLEGSLSLLLKAAKLVDFDNKRTYFRSRVKQQHDDRHYGSLRICVRRSHVLEDSYHQLRMRSADELRGRLTVQFQGEEGIDAGGLTREWYLILSRAIFNVNNALFVSVNNATFQPNPNSHYQGVLEHLSYFKFIGRVVAKALYDGQLLDAYFTRSFYKHMLGVPVTYHDIEANDPEYYKNLKWMLENDISNVLELTFSAEADEQEKILFGTSQVVDLIPNGRNIAVTDENKREYVNLITEHRMTNAIKPQIAAFLDGFNELVPRDLISIFNDRELELLISGLPEIDVDDLRGNTEYTGYSNASPSIQWFWEIVCSFSKEDLASLLQFVTGTSKVPLDGFKSLQGISGPQKFQIHRAYGAPERLPSAHTCFNQLDLPEYANAAQLRERLLLAIHEASEGFGFG